MGWSGKIALAASVAFASPCLAAPLILYNAAPGAAEPVAALPSGSPTCGTFTTPCTNLTATNTLLAPEPFLPGWTYGLSGEASVGVSNHGHGGGIGVTAWMEKDDFSLGLTLNVNQQTYDGKNYYLVPAYYPRH